MVIRFKFDINDLDDQKSCHCRSVQCILCYILLRCTRELGVYRGRKYHDILIFATQQERAYDAKIFSLYKGGKNYWVIEKKKKNSAKISRGEGKMFLGSDKDDLFCVYPEYSSSIFGDFWGNNGKVLRSSWIPKSQINLFNILQYIFDQHKFFLKQKNYLQIIILLPCSYQKIVLWLARQICSWSWVKKFV